MWKFRRLKDESDALSRCAGRCVSGRRVCVPAGCVCLAADRGSGVLEDKGPTELRATDRRRLSVRVCSEKMASFRVVAHLLPRVFLRVSNGGSSRLFA